LEHLCNIRGLAVKESLCGFGVFAGSGFASAAVADGYEAQGAARRWQIRLAGDVRPGDHRASDHRTS
jgi:hypothetical protein